MYSESLTIALIARTRAVEHYADRLCNALCAGSLANAERYRDELMALMRTLSALSDLIQEGTKESNE